MNSFGDIWTEELLYGGISRFKRELNFNTDRDLVKTLFGTTNIVAAVEMPCRIAEFVKRLSPTHTLTVDRIIDDHTLFPYFTAFISPERAACVRDMMIGDQGKNIFAKLGVLRHKIRPNEYLRYCPLCVVEDRDTFGEAYYHRIHQVPGIIVCPTHKSLTHDSPVAAHSRRIIHYEYQALEDQELNLEIKLENDIQYGEIHLEIAKYAEWLLTNPHNRHDITHYEEHYRRALADQGYSTYSNIIRTKQFLPAFYEKFPQDFLASINLSIDENNLQNWVYRTIRQKKETISPMYHILVNLFLEIDPAYLFSSKVPKFFGEGPWPCMNPVCINYKKRVIQNIDISTNSHNRKLQGGFRCKCGYTYRRYGPDYAGENHYKIDHILEYGTEWEDFLKSVWMDKNWSLRGIAEKLGVDTRTVQCYSDKLDLPKLRPGAKFDLDVEKFPRHKDKKSTITDQKIQKNREKFSNLVRNNPNLSISELRAANMALHAFLYRYDREFLIATRPKPLPKRNNNSYAVDWNQRDLDFCEEINRIVENMLCSEEKPKLICKSAISNRGNFGANLFDKLHKLPKTKALLENVVESRIEFAFRRIHWNKEKVINSGECCKKWELEKMSGLCRLNKDPVIIKELDNAYKEIIKHFGSPQTLR